MKCPKCGSDRIDSRHCGRRAGTAAGVAAPVRSRLSGLVRKREFVVAVRPCFVSE
jgi:hypothetical protein